MFRRKQKKLLKSKLVNESRVHDGKEPVEPELPNQYQQIQELYQPEELKGKRQYIVLKF